VIGRFPYAYVLRAYGILCVMTISHVKSRRGAHSYADLYAYSRESEREQIDIILIRMSYYLAQPKRIGLSWSRAREFV